MTKPTVHIKTTIPSDLTAWPSRDPTRATDQQVTRDWWAQRNRFDLFVSQTVIDECRAGDHQAAMDRLQALHGIPLLRETSFTENLTRRLIREVPLPRKAAVDAGHIALATVYQVDYLLTWNCRHIANPTFFAQIETICQAFQYRPPVICTPAELFDES